MPERERWYVYLARCGDGSLYTGIARDVTRRLAQHAAGTGARYTRGRGPISLHAVQLCLSRSRALRLELLVKSLPRADKEDLADPTRFRRVARSLAPARALPAPSRAGPDRRKKVRPRGGEPL